MPNATRRPGRPRTYRERLNVYLDGPLKAQLATEAARSGDSEGEIVRDALTHELQRRERRRIVYGEDATPT